MARYLIAMTGASGAIHGVDFVKRCPGEKYLVLSDWARQVLHSETGLKPSDLEPHVKRVFQDSDLAAPFSSGSNRYDALVVIPCSVSTLAKMAVGIADTLITRAAQVALKERMRVVLCLRETPLGSDRARERAQAVARGRRDRADRAALVPRAQVDRRPRGRLHRQGARAARRGRRRGLAGGRAGMKPFHSLTDFLAELEKRGDLKRVKREVDWGYEVTEIACREAKAEGPALLFEHVSRIAVPARGQRARGAAPHRVGARAHAGRDRRGARGAAARAATRPRRAVEPARQQQAAARHATEARDQGAVTGGVACRPISTPLPNLKLWPQDGGRFVTFGLVHTQHPENGTRNLGIYRMHVYDVNTTGMHWQIGKGGGFHYHAAEKRGHGLDVAVAVGADPATLLAAVAPLPEGIDELAFAGFLRGEPTRITPAQRPSRSRCSPRRSSCSRAVVPAELRAEEGPFGDHFGHYSHVAPFPVFRLSAITHRRKPVYQASVVGKPRRKTSTWARRCRSSSPA